MQFTLYKGRR